MIEDKPKKRVLVKTAESSIIGFLLPKETAAAIKEESVRRGMKLNHFLEELWEGYKKRNRDF